jgi:hypothetical protein
MVHFVGAGSGAADLITVRGAKLLGECDVVIYAGSLVNPALLAYCRKDCRIYNSAEMTLEQVIDAIDAYEAQVDEYYANKGDEEECGCGCSHDEGSCEDSDDDVIPSDDPIVLEVERLIAAYSDRFDELCKENGEVPEEALTYKPRTPIEQVAFDIFTDALHDSLMDEDDE